MKKLIDVHINNLNNIHNTISRLSNIGYTLISIVIGLSSIFFPIILSVKMNKISKNIITTINLFFILFLFFCSLINLRNERIWIKIYNEKSKINVFDIFKENKNPIKKILNYNFRNWKKKITIFSSLKSFLSIIWVGLILINISILFIINLI